MILCPVCGKGNGDLAVTCVSCSGYLQSRVDALDLFTTAWAVIESPARAFRKIALATHKNYTLLLASLFGMAWMYTALWLAGGSAWLPSLFVIIIIGVLAGPLLGISSLLGAVTIALWLGRRMGGQSTFRNLFSLTSYSMVPIVLSLIFVLPVDIAIFGPSFFGFPPAPWEIKPMIYGVLLAIHTGTLVWTFGLLVVSSSVAHGLAARKGIGIALLVAVVLSAVAFIPQVLWG